MGQAQAADRHRDGQVDGQYQCAVQPTGTTVVAGILEQQGRILICRRRLDQPHPRKWEFPGGKLETGETEEAALIRELREELGIEVQGGTELTRYNFSYPCKPPILLVFFRVSAWRNEVANRVFESVAWESPQALQTYDFLEGDGPFLKGLTEGLY